MQEFLGDLHVQPVPANCAAISWVELPILFEMQSGAKWFQQTTPGWRKQGTLLAWLCAFKQTARRVVIMFSEAFAKTHRFADIGFTNILPAVRFLMVLDSAVATSLVVNLLTNRIKPMVHLVNMAQQGRLFVASR